MLASSGEGAKVALEERESETIMGRVSNAKERLMEAVLELIWTGSYGNTTIDHICEKAGVKKGSFYYFFDSKADLAATAFETNWRVKRAELDSIFSAAVPPLERLQKYCDFSYHFQSEMKSKYGRVLGCPLFALGAEVCTQEDRLRRQVQAMLADKCKYLASAVRDAHASGVIHAPDAEAKARMILAYFEGVLTQARIQNDVKVLRDTARGIYAMLGVKGKQAAA
jgi:TetR/AcrR family transcriptional regulator, transcriptional repressor for nem operon